MITNSRYWQVIVKFCKSNFYPINIALKYIVLPWDISRYLKIWEKRRTTICCVRYFFC